MTATACSAWQPLGPALGAATRVESGWVGRRGAAGVGAPRKVDQGVDALSPSRRQSNEK